MTNSIPQPGLTSDRTLTNGRVLRGQEYFVADTDETGLGAVDAVPEAGTPTSQWSEAWHYLRRRPLFWVSAILIVLAIAIALFPGLFTSTDPRECMLSRSLNGPEDGHIFGFDRQGCDIYSRMIYGARASVTVGVLTTLIVTVLGGLIGAIAGYFGGIWDTLLSRLTDIFFAVPLVLAAIVVMSMFQDRRSIWMVVFALSMFGWTQIARITRGAVMGALAPILTPPARDPNLPHDLSPMGMFWAADIVVKAVMIGLAIASVITWTVLVVKALELWGASATAQKGIRRIQRAGSLDAAVAASGNRRDAVSRMIRQAAEEYRRSEPALKIAGDHGVKERVESQLERIEAVAGRRMGRGTGVLATIGSTAPFVGLFGTVWGIMNSFIGISESQTTNLAVVAPGIAEALLATAIGLVAAIPAVVIYNVFARGITGYRLRLANAAAGVRQLVSRDLDFRGLVAKEG